MDYAKSGSLLVIGTALIIDGCRRIIGSEAFQEAWSSLKNWVIHLVEINARIICKSVDDISSLLSNPAAGLAIAVTGGIICATTIGSSVAVGSVTVLGSDALGTAALSLGLVSAPVLPVVAVGAAATVLIYGVWRWLTN